MSREFNDKLSIRQKQSSRDTNVYNEFDGEISSTRISEHAFPRASDVISREFHAEEPEVH